MTWLYYEPIAYWIMRHVFGMTERASRANADEPLVGVFTFFILVIVVAATVRFFGFLLHAFLPPSMRPSFGILLAVPPVIPHVNLLHIVVMLTALVALIYLFTI